MSRIVWFVRPGVAEVRADDAGPAGAGEIELAGAFSGVSAGTERMVLLRRVPKSAQDAMALPSMRGDFALPIAYGYGFVGESADGRAGLALHPHADVARIPAAAFRALPQHVDRRRLTLAPQLETAVNIVWDAEVALGDRVVVLGLGVVGLLVAWLARRAGAAVVGTEPDPARRAVAQGLGIESEARASKALLGSADAIVDCAGAPEALAEAIDGAGSDARVVIAAWYGDATPALPLGGTFHPHRVRIVSSQVGHLPSHRRARWDGERRWALVGSLLDDPALDTLIAPAVPLADAPRVYSELAAGARWSPPHVVFALGEGSPALLGSD